MSQPGPLPSITSLIPRTRGWGACRSLGQVPGITKDERGRLQACLLKLRKEHLDCSKTWPRQDPMARARVISKANEECGFLSERFEGAWPVESLLRNTLSLLSSRTKVGGGSSPQKVKKSTPQKQQKGHKMVLCKSRAATSLTEGQAENRDHSELGPESEGEPRRPASLQLVSNRSNNPANIPQVKLENNMNNCRTRRPHPTRGAQPATHVDSESSEEMDLDVDQLDIDVEVEIPTNILQTSQALACSSFGRSGVNAAFEGPSAKTDPVQPSDEDMLDEIEVMGELLIEASQVVARRRCLAASVVREDDVGDKVTSGAFAADATGTAGRRAAHVLGDDISCRSTSRSLSPGPIPIPGSFFKRQSTCLQKQSSSTPALSHNGEEKSPPTNITKLSLSSASDTAYSPFSSAGVQVRYETRPHFPIYGTTGPVQLPKSLMHPANTAYVFVERFLREIGPGLEELAWRFIEGGLVDQNALLALHDLPEDEQLKMLKDDLGMNALQACQTRVAVKKMCRYYSSRSENSC